MISSHKPDGIYKVDPAGNVVWNYTDIRHPQALDADKGGSIFCSEISGARMISGKGKLLWRYTVPEGMQNPVARILGEGRYLVGNEGPGVLLEIDSFGRTLERIPLAPDNHAHHGQFRFCRKTAYGSYLAPLTRDGKVQEVSRDGEVMNEFTSLRQPVGAVRLSNGNTLIGSFRRLDEFNPEGQLIWTFNPVEDGNLPEGEGGHVCEIRPLEDGRIAFTFYHTNSAWPDIMVVNKAKKVLSRTVLPEIDKVAGLYVVSE
ncbi:hypothetical protein EGM51_13585 [Verrucomicrobia bacterium S94]|nr:hypothetical protein EGM51_13585 [Verrucomicrobia bacterium S94]